MRSPHYFFIFCCLTEALRHGPRSCVAFLLFLLLILFDPLIKYQHSSAPARQLLLPSTHLSNGSNTKKTNKASRLERNDAAKLLLARRDELAHGAKRRGGALTAARGPPRAHGRHRHGAVVLGDVVDDRGALLGAHELKARAVLVEARDVGVVPLAFVLFVSLCGCYLCDCFFRNGVCVYTCLVFAGRVVVWGVGLRRRSVFGCWLCVCVRVCVCVCVCARCGAVRKTPEHHKTNYTHTFAAEGVDQQKHAVRALEQRADVAHERRLGGVVEVVHAERGEHDVV